MLGASSEGDVAVAALFGISGLGLCAVLARTAGGSVREQDGSEAGDDQQETRGDGGAILRDAVGEVGTSQAQG